VNDALCTGTEEEELRCEAAEIGEGVTALAVLSRVSSLAQSAAGPDIAQCEADSLEIKYQRSSLTAAAEGRSAERLTH
jgi:hypothetical protein